MALCGRDRVPVDNREVGVDDEEDIISRGVLI